MKTLGIAVWGLGQHSIKRILPALEACKNISLIGVCSRDQEIVNNCSKYWGCIGWINPNEMLEDVEVEIVYIASPIGLHAAHSKKVLIAGKNVWCEKPLTCNHNDTISLVNLAKKSNKILREQTQVRGLFCKNLIEDQKQRIEYWENKGNKKIK